VTCALQVYASGLGDVPLELDGGRRDLHQSGA
jgi:hypothetical protein